MGDVLGDVQGYVPGDVQEVRNRRLAAMYGEYIDAAYSADINPLPALRRKAGGKWLFFRETIDPVVPEDADEWAVYKVKLPFGGSIGSVVWVPEPPDPYRTLGDGYIRLIDVILWAIVGAVMLFGPVVAKCIVDPL